MMLANGLSKGLIGLCLLFPIGPAHAQSQTDRLRADLLTGRSATQILGEYCGVLKLSDPPAIRALRDAVTVPASPEVRALLTASPGETVRYRRVRLACGDHVLSVADNWYLPSRLTSEMNRLLDETETPFGTAVRALGFHRKTLEAVPVAGAGIILRVRAVLLTKDDKPFSLVVENYSSELATPH
jgi:DNA-binding GntR family transcriptional regulator